MRRGSKLPVKALRLGAKGQEHKEQKEILQDIYPEYESANHDRFVMRYNHEYATE